VHVTLPMLLGLEYLLKHRDPDETGCGCVSSIQSKRLDHVFTARVRVGAATADSITTCILFLKVFL
jgi:hypothetical protein